MTIDNIQEYKQSYRLYSKIYDCNKENGIQTTEELFECLYKRCESYKSKKYKQDCLDAIELNKDIIKNNNDLINERINDIKKLLNFNGNYNKLKKHIVSKKRNLTNKGKRKALEMKNILNEFRNNIFLEPLKKFDEYFDHIPFSYGDYSRKIGLGRANIISELMEEFHKVKPDNEIDVLELYKEQIGMKNVNETDLCLFCKSKIPNGVICNTCSSEIVLHPKETQDKYNDAIQKVITLESEIEEMYNLYNDYDTIFNFITKPTSNIRYRSTINILKKFNES